MEVSLGWNLKEFNGRDRTQEEGDQRGKEERGGTYVEGRGGEEKSGATLGREAERGHPGDQRHRCRHAKGRRVCARSKRWWNDEITELRKTLGTAKHARLPAAVREACRNLRIAIRRAKNLLEQLPRERPWCRCLGSCMIHSTATGRQLETTHQRRLRARNHQRRRGRMILEVPFLNPTRQRSHCANHGDEARHRVTRELVGRILLGGCSNGRGPDRRRSGSGIRSGSPPSSSHASKAGIWPRGGDANAGKPDYRQVSAPGHCPTGLAGQSGGKDSSSPDLGPA